MAVSWISLTSSFPGMLLTCFLNNFEIVPVAPFVTGITFVLTFHMRCISILRSLYFRIFSASFLITFLSPEIATSINIHVPFSLSRIIMSDLLLGIVLSVCYYYYYYYYYRYYFSFTSLKHTVSRYSMLRLLCHITSMFHAKTTLAMLTNIYFTHV